MSNAENATRYMVYSPTTHEPGRWFDTLKDALSFRGDDATLVVTWTSKVRT